MEYFCITKNELDKNYAIVDDIVNLLNQLTGLKDDSENILKMLNLLLQRKDYYIIVAYEDKAVGLAMGIVCPNICYSLSPFMIIENVVVDFNYRRKGIGKALIEALEKWAIFNECKYITLSSQHSRTDAHRFYEALGYAHDDAFQKFLL